jgi:hypothetical protein
VERRKITKTRKSPYDGSSSGEAASPVPARS